MGGKSAGKETDNLLQDLDFDLLKEDDELVFMLRAQDRCIQDLLDVTQL